MIGLFRADTRVSSLGPVKCLAESEAETCGVFSHCSFVLVFSACTRDVSHVTAQGCNVADKAFDSELVALGFGAGWALGHPLTLKSGSFVWGWE
jgi:hypothetical protein